MGPVPSQPVTQPPFPPRPVVPPIPPAPVPGQLFIIVHDEVSGTVPAVRQFGEVAAPLQFHAGIGVSVQMRAPTIPLVL